MLWTRYYSSSAVIGEDPLLCVERDAVFGQTLDGFGFVPDGTEDDGSWDVDNWWIRRLRKERGAGRHGIGELILDEFDMVGILGFAV